MLLLTLAACGSKKEDSSAKKDSDPNSITLLTEDKSDVRPKNKDLWMWKEYEKMSGVKVNWTEVKDFGDKKNLILTKKDLPDAFYQAGFSNDELVKYGTQGIFIPLEKYIESDAPNLSKIFKEHPDIKKSLVAPDGHIYGLPYLSLDPMAGGRTFRYYINKPWLDKLGLGVPKNLTEMKDMLKAFVTKDPNGNGKADEQGFSMNSGNVVILEKLVGASMGLQTAGRTADDNRLYMKNDKLEFAPTSDELKNTWKFMADMYKDGLIAKTNFSNYELDKWIADASKDTVGMWAWVSPERAGATVEKNYIPVNIIPGDDGTRKLVTQPDVMGAASFMITNKAKDPAKLIKWVDFFYGEEGSEFGYLGKEGVTYNVKDGKKVWIDDILNYAKGGQLGAYQYVDNVYAGNFPYLELPQKMKEEAFGMDAIDNSDVKESDIPNPNLPTFMSTPEEAQELSTLLTDLNKFYDESRVKFVTGKWNFDSDWDNYVKQLEKMGSEKYLKIRRTQYDRWQNAK